MAKKKPALTTQDIVDEIYDPDAEPSSPEAIDALDGKRQLEQALGLFANESAGLTPMMLEPYGRNNIFGVEVKLDAGGQLIYEVLVRKKSSDTQTLGPLAIPSTIKGIPVKVFEIPDEAEFQVTQPGDPIFDRSRVTYGTLGAIVKFRGVPGKKFLLSNQHVIASGSPVDGQAVYDAARTQIGKLSFWSPYNSDKNLIDFAIAELTGPGAVAANVYDYKGHFTMNPHSILLGDVRSRARSGRFFVKKVGAKTSLTMGIVSNDNQGTVRVKGRLFVNQITVLGLQGKPFSEGGDSGSLVVSHPDNRPIGMLFAGVGNRSYVNPVGSLEYVGVEF